MNERGTKFYYQTKNKVLFDLYLNGLLPSSVRLPPFLPPIREGREQSNKNKTLNRNGSIKPHLNNKTSIDTHRNHPQKCHRWQLFAADFEFSVVKLKYFFGVETTAGRWEWLQRAIHSRGMFAFFIWRHFRIGWRPANEHLSALIARHKKF